MPRLAPALILLVHITACGVRRPIEMKAVAGLLDLTAHDFANSPTLVLGGEWDFYRGKFFSTAAEASAVIPERVVLPQTWNGEGTATYRLKLRLPPVEQTFAVHMEAQLSAYEILINGKPAAASGVPGADAGATQPATLPLSAEVVSRGDVEILLRVANFHHRKGGIFKKIYFGTSHAMASQVQATRLADMALVGILATMALYHLIIFLLRRRNKAALFYSLVCIMILGRTVTTGEKLLPVMLPAVPFSVYTMIEYLSYFWGIPFALRFFYELYPGRQSARIHSLFFIAAAFFSLAVVLLPLRLYSHTSYLYLPVMVAGIIVVAFLLIRMAWIGEPNARALLAGFSLLAVTVINDALNTVEILRTGYLAHFGFLGVIIGYAAVLAARFSVAFDQSEAAALELKYANETLEQRVSERTRELEKAKTAAEQANYNKDNFIALVSHDLRSPLSGLHSSLQVLRLAPLDAEKKDRLLSVAEKTTAEMLQIIESLLQLHRRQRGDFSDDDQLVYPRTIVESLAQSLAKPLNEKQLRINNELSAEWQLRTNPHLLRHVLRNLLTNAVKFSYAGGLIEVKREPGAARSISVTDHGIGMKAEQLKSIMRRGQQSAGAGTAGERGSGLGLTICREILESQNGSLSVISHIGSGSTFTIHLG